MGWKKRETTLSKEEGKKVACKERLSDAALESTRHTEPSLLGRKVFSTQMNRGVGNKSKDGG